MFEYRMGVAEAQALYAALSGPDAPTSAAVNVALVGQCQVVKNVLDAIQVVAMARVAATEEVLGEDGTVGERVHPVGHQRLDAPSLVADLLGVSEQAAASRMRQAVLLAASGGPVVAAMARGVLDGYRAGVVAEELADAPVTTRRAVADALGPRLGAETAGPLRRRVVRELGRVDPDHVRQRVRRARGERYLHRVTDYLGADHWEAGLPVERARDAWSAVDALARVYLEAGQVDTIEQGRADALLDLIDHSATATHHLHLGVPADQVDDILDALTRLSVPDRDDDVRRDDDPDRDDGPGDGSDRDDAAHCDDDPDRDDGPDRGDGPDPDDGPDRGDEAPGADWGGGDGGDDPRGGGPSGGGGSHGDGPGSDDDDPPGPAGGLGAGAPGREEPVSSTGAGAEHDEDSCGDGTSAAGLAPGAGEERDEDSRGDERDDGASAAGVAPGAGAGAGAGAAGTGVEGPGGGRSAGWGGHPGLGEGLVWAGGCGATGSSLVSRAWVGDLLTRWATGRSGVEVTVVGCDPGTGAQLHFPIPVPAPTLGSGRGRDRGGGRGGGSRGGGGAGRSSRAGAGRIGSGAGGPAWGGGSPGGAGYRPSARLVALVKARDGQCRFPGCTVSARFCDLDHVRPWPAGPTAAANLACLCRRHHRIKQRLGWRVRLLPDGTLRVTDPTGLVRTSNPVDLLTPGVGVVSAERADAERADAREADAEGADAGEAGIGGAGTESADAREAVAEGADAGEAGIGGPDAESADIESAGAAGRSGVGVSPPVPPGQSRPPRRHRPEPLCILIRLDDPGFSEDRAPTEGSGPWLPPGQWPDQPGVFQRLPGGDWWRCRPAAPSESMSESILQSSMPPAAMPPSSDWWAAMLNPPQGTMTVSAEGVLHWRAPRVELTGHDSDEEPFSFLEDGYREEVAHVVQDLSRHNAKVLAAAQAHHQARFDAEPPPF